MSTRDVSRSPRRGRSWVVRWAARIVLAAAIFAVGLALGDALDDNPQPGGTLTYVRTLKPLALPPAETKTITVTAP